MASKKHSQIMLDIILPKNMRLDMSGPNDVEASALYSMWKNAPPGTSAFSVPSDLAKHINSWKTKGLVDGFSNRLSLTDKGRKLIIEMVTNEPNSFDKRASAPRYSVVKAKKKETAAKAPSRRTSRTASEKTKPFNLRKDKNARHDD